jgi:uncharacterized membrane protein HdeD (DUF308 family)
VATRPAGRLLVTRATIALVAGLTVTFSANHSPFFGLIVFGIFAALTGFATVIIPSDIPTDRALAITRGVVSCTVGACALALCTGTADFYVFLVSSWAAAVGFLEVYAGLRARPSTVASRDATIIGGLTAILALVLVLIPADPVLAIGLFGVFVMLLGTHSMIAGLSLRWAVANREGGSRPQPASRRRESENP